MKYNSAFLFLILGGLFSFFTTAQNDATRIRTWNNEVYTGPSYRLILHDDQSFYQLDDQFIT